MADFEKERISVPMTLFLEKTGKYLNRRFCSFQVASVSSDRLLKICENEMEVGGAKLQLF